MAKSRIAISVLLLFLVLIYAGGSAHAELAQTKKYVAFRDDDVSPFTSLEPLKAVNQVHIDENIPVTLGIIPHPLDGQSGNQLLQDDQFLIYMRSIAANPLFEFAQHGYSHHHNAIVLTSEFTGLRYDYQYNLIFTGKTHIQEAFGVTPTTFIAPWNNGDSNTTDALTTLGFTEYSKGFSPNHIQYGYKGGMRIEGSFNIGGRNDTNFNTSIQEAKQEVERFLADPQSGDTLGITYHAAAFVNNEGVVDSHKIQLFVDFVEFLKTKAVLFTRLDRSSVAETSNVASPSPAVLLNTLTIDNSTPLAVDNGTPLTINTSTSSIFLLVSSIGITLFGIYYSAQPRDRQRNKPR